MVNKPSVTEPNMGLGEAWRVKKLRASEAGAEGWVVQGDMAAERQGPLQCQLRTIGAKKEGQ
jgi:hypothetical protein